MPTKTVRPPQKWQRITFQRVGLAGLKDDLAAFEKKYGMTTEVFVQKVWSGELEECDDFVDWLGLSEIRKDMLNGRAG